MRPIASRQMILLRILLWVGIALLLLTPSINWLLPMEPLGAGMAERPPLSMSGRLLAWFIAAPPYLAGALGLGQMLSFSNRFRLQRVFTAEAALLLQRFGWCLIAASITFPLSRLLLGMFLGLGINGLPTQFLPLIGLGGILPAAIGFTIGLIFVQFAGILRQAAVIAEENAGFV